MYIVSSNSPGWPSLQTDANLARIRAFQPRPISFRTERYDKVSSCVSHLTWLVQLTSAQIVIVIVASYELEFSRAIWNQWDTFRI